MSVLKLGYIGTFGITALIRRTCTHQGPSFFRLICSFKYTYPPGHPEASPGRNRRPDPRQTSSSCQTNQATPTYGNISSILCILRPNSFLTHTADFLDFEALYPHSYRHLPSLRSTHSTSPRTLTSLETMLNTSWEKTKK